jgi:acid phosphatase family membrane protein YuiD
MGLQVMYDASGVHLQAGRQAEVFEACHFSLSAF